MRNPSKYLAKIGRKGGQKSRRSLSPETAKNMVKIREARRIFKKYHSRCFWSFDPQYKVQLSDLAWLIEQLKKNGDRKLRELASKLCH